MSGDTSPSDENEHGPERLESWTLWLCGSCERKYATENADIPSQCPYCGSRVGAAATEAYDVVRQ